MWLNWQWTYVCGMADVTKLTIDILCEDKRQSLLDNTLISLVMFKYWQVLVTKVSRNVAWTGSNVDPTVIWQHLQWPVWWVLNLYGKTVLYSVLFCSLWNSLELNPNIKQGVTVRLLLHLNPNSHINQWMFMRTKNICNTGFKENYNTYYEKNKTSYT